MGNQPWVILHMQKYTNKFVLKLATDSNQEYEGICTFNCRDLYKGQLIAPIESANDWKVFIVIIFVFGSFVFINI